MKTCPVCALDVEDSYLFCPDDGSSLQAPPATSTEPEQPKSLDPDDETAGAVVLYCPTCAAEYPLTFSTCPVHGVQLTKHRIPRLPAGASDFAKPDEPVETRASAAVLNSKRSQLGLTSRLTALNLARPEMESPRSATTTLSPDDVKHDDVATPADFPEATVFSGVPDSEAAYDRPGLAPDADERGVERRGFRVAALVTIIALAVFGLAALYTLVSNFSRRASASKAQIAREQQNGPQPPPFLATPQAAQDYKEETPVQSPSPAPETQTEQPLERARTESRSASPPEPGVRKPPAAPTLPKAEPPASPSPPATTARVSNPPMPTLPRGDSGGFDARLIRVRSRKIDAGFRYELTFNMLEQAGRAAQWQRVLISTRSASGMNHSQAIPFSHRLGAAGALTFTISVELTGRSEADWQGRIVCTTLGWDNKGGPLQASFGANVTP